MSTYSTGTVSISNGSTALSGTGGMQWASIARAGDLIAIGAALGVVATVNSNTGITLSRPWSGGNVSGGAYDLILVDAGNRDTVSLHELLVSLGSGNINALAGLSGSADQLPYFVGAGTMGLSGLTSQGRSLLDQTILSRSGNDIVTSSAARLTGGAVTSSDTDTTAGRVLRTGHRVYPALRSDSADTGAVSTSDDRAVIASGSSRASGVNTVVGASGSSHAAGDRNAIFGMSDGLIQNGNRNLIAGGNICTIDGANTSAILASLSCTLTASQAMILAGRRVLNSIARSIAIGDAASGDPLSANRKIHMFAETGNIQIAGSLTSSHAFADFAEMFPNATGAEILLGTIVTEENGAVRPAGPDDEIAGVVTATAVVTAGDTPFTWQGRYLSDEWGQRVMEMIPDPEWEGEGPAPMISAQVENPAWNPAATQIPRSERPDEWTRVGLLGQVFARVAEEVAPGDRLSALDGIGVKSAARTGLRCMTITQPFDAAKGYAVARCLINIQV